eukprot:gene17807-24216_t
MAAALGEPGAARAVGQALGHNPFAPVVPCHRILAANGRPGGFSAGGGALTKLRMLAIEDARPNGLAQVAASAGSRRKVAMREAKMIPACSAKPASASSRQADSPCVAPTSPPSAAPIGRAPVLIVRNTADTRPSMAGGATLWRSVAEVMTQTIGPAPKRKNDSE